MNYIAVIHSTKLKRRGRSIRSVIINDRIQLITERTLGDFLEWLGSRKELSISRGCVYVPGTDEDNAKRVKYILSPDAEILWDQEVPLNPPALS